MIYKKEWLSKLMVLSINTRICTDRHLKSAQALNFTSSSTEVRNHQGDTVWTVSLCLGQYHDVVLLCMYSDGLWNSHNLARTPNRGGRVNAKTKVCARKNTHAHNRFKPCIHLHFRTCKYIGINVKNTPALTHTVLTHGVCVREDHLATTIPWAVLTAIYLDHRQHERLTPPS